MAIPHNPKCRYGERGAAAAKPKAQIILCAAKVSATSGGCSEPKQGQAVAECEGLLPRSTMRVPQPDIIEHFGNADAVPQPPYPVLYTLSPDGCTAHVPDFPKIVITASTLDAALLEVKQQIQKALRQYKNPPIPTKQDQIVVPTNGVLVLVKAS